MTDHLRTAKIAFDDANASRYPETRDDFLFVAELNILASSAESLQAIAANTDQKRVNVTLNLKQPTSKPQDAPGSPSTPDPAPTDPPNTEGPQIDAEPPAWSVVLDCNGDAWQYGGITWYTPGFEDGTSWENLNSEYSPLTVIYRPDDTPEDRAHRACKEAEMVAVKRVEGFSLRRCRLLANQFLWDEWDMGHLMHSYADGLDAQEAL